jgi:hypothetical protein
MWIESTDEIQYTRESWYQKRDHDLFINAPGVAHEYDMSYEFCYAIENEIYRLKELHSYHTVNAYYNL